MMIFIQNIQALTVAILTVLVHCAAVSRGADPYPLWTGDEFPKAAEVPFAVDMAIFSIEPPIPATSNGRIWRKGVDVIWHKGVLHASFGYNEKFDTQGENSPGESCAWLTSGDGGKTWSNLRFITRGDETSGISHGVFLSHEGRLWSFNGSFSGKFGKVRTLAFLLDETSDTWEPKGEVVGAGFWALQKPMKLPDGNWLMSGARIGKPHPAAVAISHGDDLLKWDLVVIPEAPGKMWGESSVIRDGDRLLNIARYGAEAVALAAVSTDGGRTWTPSSPSNLPMTTSRPYTGRLSSGQPYLVCTTTADSGTKRNPLTIAVGAPNTATFSRVFKVDDDGSMMYPGCDEHEGWLYIGYTRGFSPQLAVVPVSSLAIDAAGVARREPKPPSEREWELDSPLAAEVTVHGEAKRADGAQRHCLVLEGQSTIELNDSAHLNFGTDGFTVSLWFNPYDLAGGQQMLVGKNRYSRNERQWSLTIEPDGKLKAHLQQGGWSTITCDQPLEAGRWHLATLVVTADKASLFLNGRLAGDVKLKTAIASTEAPITLGGIWDSNSVRQAFYGALDEFSVQPRALNAQEIASSYRPVSSTHEIPKFNAGLPLWDDSQKLLKAAELPQVAGAEFHVIKKQWPDTDGCNWTLGVGLAWHKGKLYASYGYNKGKENTPTEEAHVRVSDDGGKTWGPTGVMDAGDGDLGVSHGVFLSHGARLWAFMGAFYASARPYYRVHTRAYRLNEGTGQWEAIGSVVEGGFWPMQEPLKMADGNWIMSGFRIGGQDGNLPAVAISSGDDFTKWNLIVIPAAPGLGKVWGESTVIVEGKRIINISRYGAKSLALASFSEDFGRTWTPSSPSNLPMATSKPYAGTLSTGHRYLVCTTTADTGGKRSPLTIAMSKPGESVFSKVFVIRRSLFPGGPGVSSERADFSYPYAIEHEGKLYVGYTHKSHVANELAVIPIRDLLSD
jgi:hypothetical protein